MAAASFFRRFFQDLVRVDAASIEPLYALRCTLGVAIPLVVALLAAHPLSGVSAALGAQVVGFASRQGVYRTRAVIMLFTAAATGSGALVGSLTGDNPALNIIVTIVWGMGFGLLSSLGNAANIVGLQSLVALIVFSKIGFSGAQAAQQALLVVAGGVLQTILLVLVWPLQRFSAERTVLQRAYRALAEFAGHISEHTLETPSSQTLQLVKSTLADPQPFAKRGETAVFEALLVEAERLRATIAAISTDRYTLASQGFAEPAQALVTFSGHARDVLVEIADALTAARAPDELAATWTALDRDVVRLETALSASRPGSIEHGVLQQSVGDGRALSGQLRAAWRAGKAPDQPNPGPPSQSAAARLFHPSVLNDALATLRANATLQSPFGRHALRVGLTLLAACTLEHTLPLPRAYWIPLTAAIVLRPDFGATFTRGIARVSGTFLGALGASLIALLLRPAPQTYLVLALFAAGVAYLTVAANFALFSVGVTAYVIFLLAFGGLAEHTAVVERLSASIIGGVLALLAYAIWPAWERERVSVELATYLERVSAYGNGVLSGYSDSAARDERELFAIQLEARLARANAEASVDRMLAEPVHARTVGVRAALGILSAGRRYSLAALTLQARLTRAATFNHPALTALRAALADTLVALANALRDVDEPPLLAPLRDLQIELRRQLLDDRAVEAGMLISETDLMVDSVNSIAGLMHAAHQARAVNRSRRRTKRWSLKRSVHP